MLGTLERVSPCSGAGGPGVIEDGSVSPSKVEVIRGSAHIVPAWEQDNRWRWEVGTLASCLNIATGRAFRRHTPPSPALLL